MSRLKPRPTKLPSYDAAALRGPRARSREARGYRRRGRAMLWASQCGAEGFATQPVMVYRRNGERRMNESRGVCAFESLRT